MSRTLSSSERSIHQILMRECAMLSTKEANNKYEAEYQNSGLALISSNSLTKHDTYIGTPSIQKNLSQTCSLNKCI